MIRNERSNFRVISCLLDFELISPASSCTFGTGKVVSKRVKF